MKRIDTQTQRFSSSRSKSARRTTSRLSKSTAFRSIVAIQPCMPGLPARLVYTRRETTIAPPRPRGWQDAARRGDRLATVETVQGPIEASDLGTVLVHEHVRF